ncbi:hypothetical protein Y1Q_0001552 [Alligator mississippiensis]|uniref:Uncharacterized protein n=1 Tax=Alligator mississippiensis TaxID=8496 RepID=A0A151M9X4_ALLMI|nr:hypothetical protein Y1Q_0001552 [Alligator mississippiensis]
MRILLPSSSSTGTKKAVSSSEDCFIVSRVKVLSSCEWWRMELDVYLPCPLRKTGRHRPEENHMDGEDPGGILDSSNQLLEVCSKCCWENL